MYVLCKLFSYRIIIIILLLHSKINTVSISLNHVILVYWLIDSLMIALVCQFPQLMMSNNIIPILWSNEICIFIVNIHLVLLIYTNLTLIFYAVFVLKWTHVPLFSKYSNKFIMFLIVRQKVWFFFIYAMCNIIFCYLILFV